MITERELRRLAMDRDASIIANDAPCRRCSYNLKGLKRSGKCPECGTPIIAPQTSVTQDTTLVTAPRSYLRRLVWSSRMLFAAATFGPPSAVILTSSVGELPGAALALAWSSLWWLAVWLITGRRQAGDGPAVPANEDRTLIFVARATQAAWPIASFLWVLCAARILPTASGLPLIVLGFVLGYLSFAVLAFRIATLVDCAADADFARMLRSSWVILLAGPVVALLVTGFGILLSVMAPLFKLALPAVAGLAWFVAINYLLWRTMNLMGWAIRISHELDERDARMVQKARQGVDRGGPRLCPHCGENVSALVRSMRCPRCGEMTV